MQLETTVGPLRGTIAVSLYYKNFIFILFGSLTSVLVWKAWFFVLSYLVRAWLYGSQTEGQGIQYAAYVGLLCLWHVIRWKWKSVICLGLIATKEN